MSTSYPVNPPFPTFRDIDGSPLNAGYVYIGSPHTNPETNPIAVYWDSDSAVPAAQPIRTINGFLSRNGCVTNLFTAEDFSITVRDKKGVIVFTAPTNEQNSALITYATAAAARVTADLADTSDVTKGDALIGVKYPFSGGIARTQHQKNQDFVSIRDFGAVGDGVTDDTIAMTAFFNSAISHPGIEHRLEAKTYGIRAPLPPITVSNTKIIGEGSEIHDVGPTLISGTVLRWIGVAGHTGTFVEIRSESGGNLQRTANITFSGIGVDCSSGGIHYGVQLMSIRDSDINVSIANAGRIGLNVMVVPVLGESKDTQRNRIRLKARQLEAPNAFCLVASGDAISNTSMNDFWVDAQHKDVQALYLVNVDNNDWHFVRCHCVDGGAIGESIALLGGPSSWECARAERFHYISANLPVHVYGINGPQRYPRPSVNSQIFCLDTENGTPGPIVDAGSSIHWRKDQSGLDNDAWIAYTPVLGAQSGTLTSASAQGSYRRRGNIVEMKVQLSISANGSAGGYLTMTAPISQIGAFGACFAGSERSATGRAVHGWLDGGGSSLIVLRFFDGSYPGGTGYVINMSGAYEVA